jgi:hypothetical protein
MGWTPHINTSTQTLTNNVPDNGYEVMGQNFVYANYPIHSLYTHFMYKKTTTPSGADASFDYWDLYITRKNYDNTWLPLPNSSGGIIKYKSGTWSDHGTGSPNTISLSGTTVTLSQSGIWGTFTSPYPSGPSVTYGPAHGALPTTTGFSVYNLNFTKVGDREYRISYQQKNAPPNSYSVRVSHTISNGSPMNSDYTVTTAASGQTINLISGSLYGTGAQAGTITPQNNTPLTIRFMDFDAKLGSAGATISQGLIFYTWTYLYDDLTATFTPSSGAPGTVFDFTLTGSDDSYASSNTATLTDPSGTVTTFTKNAEGQFHDSVTNVTSIEGDYTVEHPTGVNRGTSTYDNSGPPIVNTTSNGEGKRRYPIISTNLFDRQKSIFSIGKTHKDETLF